MIWKEVITLLPVSRIIISCYLLWEDFSLFQLSGLEKTQQSRLGYVDLGMWTWVWGLGYTVTMVTKCSILLASPSTKTSTSLLVPVPNFLDLDLQKILSKISKSRNGGRERDRLCYGCGTNSSLPQSCVTIKPSTWWSLRTTCDITRSISQSSSEIHKGGLVSLARIPSTLDYPPCYVLDLNVDAYSSDLSTLSITADKSYSLFDNSLF